MKRTIFVYSLVLTMSACLLIVNAATVPLAGMRLIPSKDKSFLMGFSTGTDQWSCYTGQHKVTFTHDLYVDSILITQPDFLALMKFNPSSNKTGNSMLPVDQESFYDAALYCNARSKRDGLDTVYTFTSITHNGSSANNLIGLSYDIKKNGYRIPTSSEFEYIERGNSTGTYFWGNAYSDDSANKYSWWDNGGTGGNSGNVSHPVALKKPNPFGLYDIVGDLFEWTSDWDSTYVVKDQIDPIGPISSAPNLCGGGSAAKAARGGSFHAAASGHEQTCYHFKWPPDATNWEMGFRCVATALGVATTGDHSFGGPLPSPMSISVTGQGFAKIEYAVANRSDVSIAVFDCRGTLVRSVAAGAASAGKHVALWDGKNGFGKTAAAGAYIISVKIAGYTFSKTFFVAP